MQNEQLSQQSTDGESRREYKSPTLRKLGKLSDLTLATSLGTFADGMPGMTKIASV
jgi:hypothetical protein